MKDSFLWNEVLSVTVITYYKLQRSRRFYTKFYVITISFFDLEAPT